MSRLNKGKKAAWAAAAAGETLNPVTTPEEKKAYEQKILAAAEKEATAVEIEMLVAAAEIATADLGPALQAGPTQNRFYHVMRAK